MTPKRCVEARWIPKLFRELTCEEQALICRALGSLPLEPSCGTLELLWTRLKRGEVGMCQLLAHDGQPAAVTLYELEQYEDGSRNFFSLCTVSIGVANRPLAQADMPAMEALARELGCSSMAMRTIRPGLCRILTEQHGWFCSEITLRKLLK